jgi:hypothetical protein
VAIWGGGMGGWDYRTRIIPLLSSMKPASYRAFLFMTELIETNQ